MKAVELVKRLIELQQYPPHDEMAAKAAFLLNLAQVLKVELPDEGNLGKGVPGETFAFMAGVMVGRGGEIDPRDIQQAHELMSFPFTRAIISTALGYSEVTGLGVPAEYSKENVRP